MVDGEGEMRETSEKGGVGRSQITGLACTAPHTGEPSEARSSPTFKRPGFVYYVIIIETSFTGIIFAMGILFKRIVWGQGIISSRLLVSQETMSGGSKEQNKRQRSHETPRYPKPAILDGKMETPKRQCQSSLRCKKRESHASNQ